MRCSCGRADSVMDSHTTCPGFKTWLVLSTELPTDYHHNSIIELSVRCSVWNVGKGFPCPVLPKTFICSCVFQCCVPNQWIAQRQVCPMSVYCNISSNSSSISSNAINHPYMYVSPKGFSYVYVSPSVSSYLSVRSNG